MQYIKLGKTNLEISRLGIGAIPLQRFDEENAYKVLKCALENKVNFIDTARAYSISEELLGYGLEKLGASNFVIATKSMVRDYESMKRDIRTSLKNLRVDYIDLYQVHFLNSVDDFNKIFSEDGAMRALREAKEEGLIGHIGVSSHKIDIAKMLIETNEFETMQFAYNHIEEHNEEIFLLSKEYGMGTIVMKPVCGGATDYVELSLRNIASKDFNGKYFSFRRRKHFSYKGRSRSIKRRKKDFR